MLIFSTADESGLACDLEHIEEFLAFAQLQFQSISVLNQLCAEMNPCICKSKK